jgi:hypothetical protein
MKTPYTFTVQQVMNWENFMCDDTSDWEPARPMSRSGFNVWTRLIAAWKVFTGKADVLIWTGDQ